MEELRTGESGGIPWVEQPNLKTTVDVANQIVKDMIDEGTGTCLLFVVLPDGRVKSAFPIIDQQQRDIIVDVVVAYGKELAEETPKA